MSQNQSLAINILLSSIENYKYWNVICILKTLVFCLVDIFHDLFIAARVHFGVEMNLHSEFFFEFTLAQRAFVDFMTMSSTRSRAKN